MATWREAIGPYVTLAGPVTVGGSETSVTVTVKLHDEDRLPVSDVNVTVTSYSLSVSWSCGASKSGAERNFTSQSRSEGTHSMTNSEPSLPESAQLPSVSRSKPSCSGAS